MNGISIGYHDGMLVFRTPYSPALVDALKAQVPGTDRKWDGAAKAWIVMPQHGPVLQQICMQHLHVTPDLPKTGLAAKPIELRILDLRYLGRVKSRISGEETAFGWVNGGWNAIFMKAALQTWFGRTDRPDEAATLYQVLGVKADVSTAELKSAWKRLARQWHPDTCREPDAVTQFQAIKAAYDILGDDNLRQRYDAGLKLEALWRQCERVEHDAQLKAISVAQEWAPPLRCGYVMCEGREQLDRFIVHSILGWQDITRADGTVLVSSWPEGAKEFIETWVAA